MKPRIHQLFALTATLFCFSASLFVYWEEEFQYYVIENAPSLVVGSDVDLSEFFSNSKRPIYFHFFDEDCADSKISLEHFPIVAKHYQEVCEYIVVNASNLEAAALRQEYQLPSYIQIIDDSDHVLTNRLKVVTTPHALIVNTDNQLLFTGNYSDGSGLCGANTIRNSAPAVALRFLASNHQTPLFSPYQIAFTGCPIN